MAIYCYDCRLVVVPGAHHCGQCRGTNLACLNCHTRLKQGETVCSRCDVELVVPRVDDVSRAVAQIPVAVEMVSRIPDTYQAGRFGVSAEVTIPPRDATIMNEILQLVQLLHGMAARLNQFQGTTDHTRQLIRDMRSLANLAQEEVELRRGPT